MTNWEAIFETPEKVARTFHGTYQGLDRCVRWTFNGCQGCCLEDKGCDELEKYDVSIEWLQEEAE